MPCCGHTEVASSKQYLTRKISNKKSTYRNYVFYFLTMDSNTLSFQPYFSIAKRYGINFALVKQSKKLPKGSKEFTQLTQNMAKQINFFEGFNKLTIRKRSSLVSQTHSIALTTGKSTPHSKQVNTTHRDVAAAPQTPNWGAQANFGGPS